MLSLASADIAVVSPQWSSHCTRLTHGSGLQVRIKHIFALKKWWTLFKQFSVLHTCKMNFSNEWFPVTQLQCFSLLYFLFPVQSSQADQVTIKMYTGFTVDSVMITQVDMCKHACARTQTCSQMHASSPLKRLRYRLLFCYRHRLRLHASIKHISKLIGP